ncbi:CGNR zinc finger domain-containing protein [Actinacidiphila yeochonensis]|uniref:CGNR zinc finger domain-containing protein n=1 Tax=Actinacidiphila yeochonensis TaxID=89050 RepID=UPI0007C6A31D|nr:CGNR zinc finger domain-containing protein [Actinacidiphila yeochonensis]
MHDDHLALDLALTIRHDGHGGVADDLAEPAGLTVWAAAHADALAESGFAPEGRYAADQAGLAAVRAVRTAVRALFARAVPGEPSAADAGRLPAPARALEVLNAASLRAPVVHRLAWPDGGEPAAVQTPAGAVPTADLLAGALARAAFSFLAGPDRTRLRACPAPRCVRYFVQSDARQEWCKPSCGNRARVARHHARRRDAAAGAVPGPASAPESAPAPESVPGPASDPVPAPTVD